MIKKAIKRKIKKLKSEQMSFMEYKTMPGSFAHAKLCLTIEIWNFKIAIWESLI